MGLLKITTLLFPLLPPLVENPVYLPLQRQLPLPLFLYPWQVMRRQMHQSLVPFPNILSLCLCLIYLVRELTNVTRLLWGEAEVVDVEVRVHLLGRKEVVT